MIGTNGERTIVIPDSSSFFYIFILFLSYKMGALIPFHLAYLITESLLTLFFYFSVSKRA